MLNVAMLSVVAPILAQTKRSGLFLNKLFAAVFFLHHNKLDCFSKLVNCTLVLYLQARLESTRMRPLTGNRSEGRLLALPTNIRLGWK
jgi:hypothetical protein